MKKYIPLFLDVFTKFRVLKVPELQVFCEPNAHKRRIYEHLNDLIEWEYVERVSHRKKVIAAYGATPKLLREVFGIDDEKDHALRVVDLGHTLACNRAALSLMHYSFVSGLSLEHELSQNEILNFCHDRRPDGIVQVSRENLQYELAIEVESTVKTFSRIGRILKSYQETFENKRYLCAGVIIVTTNENTFNAYQSEILKMPSSFRDRVILQNDLGLENLNQKYFGARLNRALDNPHSPPQTTRSFCGGAVRYLPMKSIEAIIPDRNKRHLQGASQ